MTCFVKGTLLSFFSSLFVFILICVLFYISIELFKKST